jgi:hypothetical protein
MIFFVSLFSLITACPSRRLQEACIARRFRR